MVSQDEMTLIWHALKRTGVSEIRYPYSGYGDSGSVEGHDEIVMDGEHEEEPDLSEIKIRKIERYSVFENGEWVVHEEEREVSLNEALVDVIHDALNSYFPGWEINEGSDGHVIVDVDNYQIEFEHNEYERVSHQHKRTMDLSPSPAEQIAISIPELE